MIFESLRIDGVFGILADPKIDERGVLLRIWDKESQLSNFNLSQASTVTNPYTNTLRGLHYQVDPFSENKVIQCVSGAVFDVVVDLRKNSKYYGMHITARLGTSTRFQGLLIPAGCAHGYITLEPNSTMVYFMDKNFSADHSRGIIWNDSSIGIEWPVDPARMSIKDENHPQWHDLDRQSDVHPELLGSY